MPRKQEKRTLALKQKLLLKFLSGDELQKAKAALGGRITWGLRKRSVFNVLFDI